MNLFNASRKDNLRLTDLRKDNTETTKFFVDFLRKIKDTKFQNPVRIPKGKYMFFKETTEIRNTDMISIILLISV